MTKDKGNRIKVTWSIDVELVKLVKHEAIDRGTDASSIIEEAIKKMLANDSKTSLAAKKTWETRKRN